jgi:uncharacterized membrane protein
MITDTSLAPEGRAPLKVPIFPTSSTEFSTAMAHYYRGEVGRMTSWRDRLDRTTNWAIAGSAAMLSVSLSNAAAHHGVLLFAMGLVFLLLVIESRRYRFFHCYRCRVRLIERNYFAQIFSPRADADPTQWMIQLADDLRAPRFSISFMDAIAKRLRRTYVWLFGVLLLAWLLKITSKGLQPPGSTEASEATGWLVENASIGIVPGWCVVVAIALFYLSMLYLVLRFRHETGELGYGEVHV